MSRSYKHTPGHTDGDKGGRRWVKRLASKKCRRVFLFNGGYFRRVTERYNICDFKVLFFTRKDVLVWGRYKEKMVCYKTLKNTRSFRKGFFK